MSVVRIAMVGCGAVAGAHLPIMGRSGRARVAVLVDKSLERAQQMATDYPGAVAIDDYSDVPGAADAAVLALPHHLHCRASVELLRRGVHVLIEKPMAMTVAECDEMIAAADEGGAVLAVGMIRRFYSGTGLVRAAVQSGMLGTVRRFDYREGAVYSWPVASDFMFRSETGGGVLADTGVHALDTLSWWFGPHAEVAYRDDAMGGVEADCEIDLRFENGVVGTVELSRTRDLRNTCIIEGDAGTLEIGVDFDPQIRLRAAGADIELSGQALHAGLDADTAADVFSIFQRQFDDFVAAIEERRAPHVPGDEGRRAVGLIEACRAVRQPLAMPWGIGNRADS